MRSKEFIPELRREQPPRAGDTTPHDYNPGWQELNDLKRLAVAKGQRMAGSQQLFVPRPHPGAMSTRDRRLKNLANRYAYDDQGNLNPNYDRWEQGIKENAPVLTGGTAVSPPGDNKPQAELWTSTAHRLDDGSWVSDWSQWVTDNQPDWANSRGYLFEVLPGARILTMNSDHDAERIHWMFQNLGRAEPPGEEQIKYGIDVAMRHRFPWDQIYKHFDAVTHEYSSGYENAFMYGWDVESTAWLNTKFLKYNGEVRVNSGPRELDY